MTHERTGSTMRSAAHTMSTPALSLHQALDLYANLGFDGVEILYTADYGCAIHPDATPGDVQHLKDRLVELGLGVAQITPYAKDFDVIEGDTRQAAIAEIRRCLALSAELGCASVRLWAGNEPQPEGADVQFERLVDTLGVLATDAVAVGVTLNIENHIGSHAITSADTVNLIQAVNSPGLGITYDPGNLLMLGEGDPVGALQRQLPYIRHVHFKDLKVLGVRSHLAAVLGDGDVPWGDLMPILKRSGYSGYFSTEFEKRWHPEQLPDSEAGLRHELAALRELWQG